jgi:hypothetical protein
MKPHIGVLGRLAFDERAVADVALRGGDPRNERVLAASNRLGTPWNIAFLVGVAASPATALTLAGELVAPACPLVLPLAASSLFLGVLVVLSTPRRKLPAVVWSSALVVAPVATSVAAELATPWISIFPVFVLVGDYWFFRVSSYNDLTRSLDNMATLAGKILRSSLRGVLSVLAGKETTRFLLARRKAGPSRWDTAVPRTVVRPDDGTRRTAGERDRS